VKQLVVLIVVVDHEEEGGRRKESEQGKEDFGCFVPGSASRKEAGAAEWFAARRRVIDRPPRGRRVAIARAGVVPSSKFHAI